MENKSSPDQFDPSQNFLEPSFQPLDPLFKPKSIALIGAKDDIGSVARTILINLTSARFKGPIYPVNPKREEVLGLKCYPSIESLPIAPDLAVIVTPAVTVPKIIAELGLKKVPSVIVISAGFKEIGGKGEALEQEIKKLIRANNIKLIGPNCLGVMNPSANLNATFAKGMALDGSIAFISQSGAMCTAVLDWSFSERIGFSSFVSVGSMADVTWGDLIHYFGDDPKTKSILMYMESVGDARSFLSAARQIALEKPIIVIKGGRSQAAANAAASHTGSLSGSDDVFDAALLRAGVLRVETISELFDMASALSRQPLPKGNKLAIITNAGGPSVLAVDSLILNRGALSPLEEETKEKLNQFLPAAWSHSNPVDILGDASSERYFKTLEVVVKDKTADGLLVVLSPQDMTDALGIAASLRPFAEIKDKPIITSWMGGDSVKQGARLLNETGIPNFAYPDDAAWCFAKMWSYSHNLSLLYETPVSLGIDKEWLAKRKKGLQILQKAIDENRSLLTEFESKELLQIYDIPTVRTIIAKDETAAMKAASEIGYPIVVKLHSETITHKTDVGGVKLNLKNEKEVQEAFLEIQNGLKKRGLEKDFQGVTIQKMILNKGFELILGSSTDPQFGPIILFGMGGEMVEIFKDSSLALPPLNEKSAEKLMEQTKIYQALKGFRGKKAVDLDTLKRTLIAFSDLILDLNRIKESDINPLIVNEEGVIALDARFVLEDRKVKDEDLPKPAIRPYPKEYVSNITLQTGENVLLRPIKPEDESLLVTFHKYLGEESIRQRYFSFLSLEKRASHDRLVRICFNDFDREIAMVAELIKNSHPEIIGVARLSRKPGLHEAHLTMLIQDPYHGKRLGSQMLSNLIEIAKKEKIKIIVADVLKDNSGMLHILGKLGFERVSKPAEDIIRMVLNL